MISDIERTNIVIVGKWNRFILNPDWVSRTLFDSDKIQVEFSFDLLLPPRYVYDSIRLTTLDDRVIVTPLSNSDECMKITEAIALKLINLLPHTPVSGLGYNYGFTYDDHHINEIVCFNDVFDRVLESSLYRAVVKRNYQFEDYTLNVEHTQMENGLNIDFNYHYSYAFFKDGYNKLLGKIISHKKQTENIIKNVYGEECNADQ
jgi:hypothetical protein